MLCVKKFKKNYFGYLQIPTDGDKLQPMASVLLCTDEPILAEGLILAFFDRDPRGSRLWRRAEFEKSVRNYRERALGLAAAIDDLRTLRGLFLLERGDAAEALRQFESALTRDVPFANHRIAERYRTLLRRHAS